MLLVRHGIVLWYLPSGSFIHVIQSPSCPLGPKYMGILGVNAWDSWNRAAWSLQEAPWNCALQTPVPPWIQGLLCHTLMACCASVAVGPLSATVVPLHLTQFAVLFVQIVTTVFLQGTWFYLMLYNTCNAWYMVLRPWVDLICCSLNQSQHLPTLPFDWGKLVYSVANQNPALIFDWGKLVYSVAN